MPQINTSLTAADSGAVTRTFDLRQGAAEGSTMFRYQRNAGAGRDQWITFGTQYSDSQANRPTTRIGYQMAFPVLRTVNSVLVPTSVARLNVSLVLPDEMTDTEAADMYTLYRNLTGSGNVAIYEMVTKRIPVWA